MARPSAVGVGMQLHPLAKFC